MAHQIVDFSDLPVIARTNLLCECPQPLILIGRPGASKSSWMEHVYTRIVAESYGVAYDDVGYAEYLVNGKDSVEASGLAFPVKSDSGEMLTQHTKPAMIIDMWEQASKVAYLVWNFDEMPQGNNDMLNLLSDVLNPEKRTLNGWAIPDNVIFCGTGNRTADKSGAKRLPSHILDRVLLAELALDIQGWVDNFAKEHVHPIIVECALAHAETEGFFAEKVPAEDTSYCTLRSLTQVSRQLEAFLEGDDFDGTIPPVLEKMFAMTIGAPAAHTVVAFCSMFDKVPSKEDILRDPETALVPDQTGFQAMAGNVAISAAYDQESGEAVIKYLSRLRPDLQVSMATKLLKRSARNGWSVGGPIAQEFIRKFHDLLPLVETAGWR